MVLAGREQITYARDAGANTQKTRKAYAAMLTVAPPPPETLPTGWQQERERLRGHLEDAGYAFDVLTRAWRGQPVRNLDERFAAIDSIREALAAAPPAPTQVTGEWTPLKAAKQLAIVLAAKHFPEVPQWRVDDDLMGVINQIDNMTTALTRSPPQPSPVVTEEELARVIRESIIATGTQSYEWDRDAARAVLSHLSANVSEEPTGSSDELTASPISPQGEET